MVRRWRSDMQPVHHAVSSRSRCELIICRAPDEGGIAHLEPAPTRQVVRSRRGVARAAR